MKFYFYIISLLASILFFNVNVYGACNYSDKTVLNKLAANVKVDLIKEEYKMDINVDDGLGEAGAYYNGYTLGIRIINVSDEIYLEFEDSNNDEIFNIYSTDLTDGIYEKYYEDMSKIRKYKIKIFSSENSSCPNEQLKTIYLTVPKLNEFKIYCNDNIDSYLCESFINVDLTYDDFMRKYEQFFDENVVFDDEEEYIDDSDNNLFYKVLYYVSFLIPIFLVIVAIIIVIKVIKYFVDKKKGKDLGL